MLKATLSMTAPNSCNNKASVSAPNGDNDKSAKYEELVRMKFDEKVQIAPLVRSVAARNALGKTEKISVRLPENLGAVTTAGATYTTVWSLSAVNASTEFAALAALYDEYRVNSISFRIGCGNQLDYTTALPQHWVFAYDPVSSGALGSTVNGISHSNHVVWIACPNNFGRSPSIYTKDGYMHMSVTVPKGTIRAPGADTIIGNDWASTSASAGVVGYLKPYLPSIGATGTTAVLIVVEYHCQFRCRS